MRDMCENCGRLSNEISYVGVFWLCARCAELSATCVDCEEIAVERGDFCEAHIPMCEICGGEIPWRVRGQHYANCGSSRCEMRYYED